ncbi:MAG TPA: choice-of-anchor Q domain-containing protein, partial [Phycisphaerales bacterium]|nr:choice-of-anchor Q domain-containing protein [Phycisphaerales bacterium]
PRGADIAGGTIQVTGSILHDDEPGPVISRIHILPTPEGAVHIATLEFTDLQGGISALTGDTSVIRWLQGNIDLPPRFDQTFHLQPGSPCIDAGSPRTLDAIQKDLQGQPRVFDGDGDSVPRTDMGASEWQPAPCPADFDNSGYVDTDDFDAFIRAFDAGC